MSRFDSLLKISYELQEFCSPDDYLSEIIGGNELSLNDLDTISAAASITPPCFKSLLIEKSK